MNRASTGLPWRGARLLAGVLAAGTVVVGASTGAVAASPGSAGGAGGAGRAPGAGRCRVPAPSQAI